VGGLSGKKIQAWQETGDTMQARTMPRATRVHKRDPSVYCRTDLHRIIASEYVARTCDIIRSDILAICSTSIVAIDCRYTSICTFSEESIPLQSSYSHVLYSTSAWLYGKNHRKTTWLVCKNGFTHQATSTVIDVQLDA